MHELIIRDAVVVDGLGNTPLAADVAVDGGRIVDIGRIAEPARHTYDAAGLTLAPGIIDLHTHYDAQLTWDRTASPSPSLGVTTIVVGNCGFGIAPCPPEFRTLVAANLSVVEGMSLAALEAGVEWGFETFPQYLDFLRAKQPMPNVAAFVGHSPVRTAVMGAEGSERAATDDEIATMKAIVTEAIAAGAIGFASSVGANHIGHGGVPMPSRLADANELSALVGILGEAGRGVFHIGAGEGERLGIDALEGLARTTGRPVVMSPIFHNPAFPERAGERLEACGLAHARGAEIYGQVSCQPLSHDFTLANAYLMYSLEAWSGLQSADPKTLSRAFSDPAFRDRYRAGFNNPKKGLIFYGDWTKVDVATCARTENKSLEGRSIAEIAAERGADPVDLFFDIALSENLETGFNAKVMNSDDSAVGRLIASDFSVIAQSDAGAHLDYFCDAGYGLYMLAHWVRDLGAIDLVEAVRRLTSVPADLYRIPDRGRIAVGAYADFILFDPARVGITKSRRVADFPAGASRLVRDPVGLEGVWVNGVPVFDGSDYIAEGRAAGHVLDQFNT
jgi:N-acyl-D-amino-acid deacylase